MPRTVPFLNWHCFLFCSALFYGHSVFLSLSFSEQGCTQNKNVGTHLLVTKIKICNIYCLKILAGHIERQVLGDKSVFLFYVLDNENEPIRISTAHPSEERSLLKINTTKNSLFWAAHNSGNLKISRASVSFRSVDTTAGYIHCLLIMSHSCRRMTPNLFCFCRAVTLQFCIQIGITNWSLF